jgi:glycosyltransferase involved in cell wall biosynthesis
MFNLHICFRQSPVINYDVYEKTRLGKIFRKLETHLRSDLYLTLLGINALKQYNLVYTMSERAGIPMAGYKKYVRNKKHLFTMFQSWSKRQENTITQLRLYNEMNTVAVHCESMKNHLANIGFPAHNIVKLAYSVDQKFFSPRKDIEQEKNFIVTVGESRSRNYPLLFRSIENLPVKLIAAASGWWYAREKERNLTNHIPKNVKIVKHLLPSELRKLYARSSFIVLPILDQISSAGITGILEAGCMERCVIVTRSRGISEFVIDGETGILIDPDDEKALREAILYLCSSPQHAQRMGKNAREYIEYTHNWNEYVRSMAEIISNNLS